MNRLLLMLVACGALFAGCDYTVPLAPVPDTAIDRTVIGLWQQNNEPHALLVLPLGDKEYLVSYPAGAKDAMFARACLCRAAETNLVQLAWFGTAQADVPDDARIYQFAGYSLTNDVLTVRMLNADLVKRDAASTDALAQGIAAARDNPRLFRETMIFTRSKDAK